MPTFDEPASPCSALTQLAATLLTYAAASVAVGLGLSTVLIPLPLDTLLPEAPRVVARSPAPVGLPQAQLQP